MDEFQNWLNQIDVLAQVNGYIGESYTDATGHDYWRTAFAAGTTPEQAFEDDAATIKASDVLYAEFEAEKPSS